MRAQTDSHFLSDTSGAVTVDWVVLTAGLVGVGLAVMATVSIGVQDTSEDIRDAMRSQLITTSFSPGVDYAATEYCADGPAHVAAEALAYNDLWDGTGYSSTHATTAAFIDAENEDTTVSDADLLQTYNGFKTYYQTLPGSATSVNDQNYYGPILLGTYECEMAERGMTW